MRCSNDEYRVVFLPIHDIVLQWMNKNEVLPEVRPCMLHELGDRYGEEDGDPYY